MTTLKKKWTGKWPGRLERETRERAFAMEWQRQNEMSRTLEYLLSDDRNHADPGAISDRDLIVANTIIQWLGSSVGQSFLVDVESRAKRMK